MFISIIFHIIYKMYGVIYFILFLLFNTIVWAHIIGTYCWRTGVTDNLN